MHPSELRSKFEREGLAVDYGQPLLGLVPDLCTLLSNSVDAHPGSTALVCLHQPWDLVPEVVQGCSKDRHKEYLNWTYAQLQYVSDLFAAGLVSNGVSRGTAIAAFLYNDAAWAMTLWAAVKLACPFVPLSPQLLSSPQELQHVLEVAKVEAVLVSDEKMAASLERNASMMMPKLILKMTAHGSPRPGWTGIQTLLNASDCQNVQCARMSVTSIEDTALIIFTSGTTALPKGCAHSQKSLTAGIYNRAKAANFHSGSRSCIHSPLFHVSSITSTLGTWMAGGSVVHPADSFDAAAVLQAIELEKCTDFPATPSALRGLLKQFSLTPTDTSSLTSVQVSSTIVLSEDLNKARMILGVPKIHSFFGMSETLTVIATSQEQALAQYSTDVARVGTVCAEARLRICAPNSVGALRRGEVGELHLGGPQVIKGYLGGANDEAFYTDEEGSWLISGDQAMMDVKGEISILGRYKDIIITADGNISPTAIEAVLENEASLNVSPACPICLNLTNSHSGTSHWSKGRSRGRNPHCSLSGAGKRSDIYPQGKTSSGRETWSPVRTRATHKSCSAWLGRFPQDELGQSPEIGACCSSPTIHA